MNENYLKEYYGNSYLKNFVIEYYETNFQPSELKNILEEILKTGKSLGRVEPLKDVDNVVAFYDVTKGEINSLLASTLKSNETLNIADVLGANYDIDDPLCLNGTNKCLLAQFGFNMASYSLYSEIDFGKLTEKSFEK